jgi:hypothetical protein
MFPAWWSIRGSDVDIKWPIRGAPCRPEGPDAEMDISKGQLVLDVAQGRISTEMFVSKFGSDPRSSPDIVRAELEQALAEKSPEGADKA